MDRNGNSGKRFELNASAWFVALIMLVLGVAILIKPHLVFSGIVLIIEVLLVVAGITSIVRAIRTRGAGGFGPGMVLGIIMLVLALMAGALATVIVSALPFFLGIILILFGVTKISTASNQRQYINVPTWPSIVYGVLIIVAGAILLLNPFGTAMVAFRIFGGYMIIMAVLEFADWWRRR